jgi:hypothetical protein
MMARRTSPNTTRLDNERAARGHGHPVQWCGRIRVDDTSTYPTTDAWIIECGPLDQHHATRRSRAITLIPNTPGQSSGRGPGTAVDMGRRPCRVVDRTGPRGTGSHLRPLNPMSYRRNSRRRVERAPMRHAPTTHAPHGAMGNRGSQTGKSGQVTPRHIRLQTHGSSRVCLRISITRRGVAVRCQ